MRSPLNPLLPSFLSLSLSSPLLINCPVPCRQQRPARTINIIYTLRPPRCKQAALHFFFFFSTSNRSPVLDHVEETNRFNCSGYHPVARISMDFDRRRRRPKGVKKGDGERSRIELLGIENNLLFRLFPATGGWSTMTPIKFIHLLYLPCKHAARPCRDAILHARIFPSTRGTEPFPPPPSPPPLSLIIFRP